MCESDKIRGVYQRTYLDRDWVLGRCGKCGLHFTTPNPTADDIRSFYVGDYHEELRQDGATERAFGAKYQRYADTIGKHLKSGRVVDVGCSTGYFVRILCDRGYQAEGVELNANSAEWGQRHFKVMIHNKLLDDCGFPRESLDLIMMTDVLEHTLHPRDFLRDAGRLLKPRGLALITFPDIASIESRYRLLWSRLLRRNWLWQTCHIPGHTWEFTRATAEACFLSAGFRVVDFCRDQPPIGSAASHWALRLINAPLRVLPHPPLNRLFGTQLEFVLQKI